MICFDCETAALPDSTLESLKPQFRPAANLKDPEKIKASIAEQEAKWRDRAALDAKTARILAIGTLDEGGTNQALCGDNEAGILEAFWDLWASGEKFVGFACHHFDAPLVWQRSIILNVRPPQDFMSGRYLSPRIIDLQSVWTCGSRDIAGQSLDAVCRACGLGGKTGNGADFGALWLSDRPAALEYLATDLELTWKLAERLGVIKAMPPF